MTRGFEFIRLQVSARVAWLEFNRAPVNAFNREMVLEVREAIAAALTDPEVRVLVLASAIPGYFSAGADLHEFEGMKARDMRGWVSICHEIARLLRSSPKPLLAAIHGTAVGGGLEMALHCDLRFAASNAKLGQPEIRIAFIPPIATTQALARLHWPAEGYPLLVRRTPAGRSRGADLGIGGRGRGARRSAAPRATLCRGLGGEARGRLGGDPADHHSGRRNKF